MKRCTALLAGLLLAGCASVARMAPPPDLAASRHFSGKLSVQIAATAEQARQGGSANFELQGQAQRGQLELSTPLGSLQARARWTEHEAVLTLPKEEQHFDDLEQLSQAMLGEAIPVAALFDWLQGRPWPQAAAQAIDAGFEQLGWQVDLSRFSDGLIVAKRLADPVVTLRVRLEQAP